MYYAVGDNADFDVSDNAVNGVFLTGTFFESNVNCSFILSFLPMCCSAVVAELFDYVVRQFRLILTVIIILPGPILTNHGSTLVAWYGSSGQGRFE